MKSQIHKHQNQKTKIVCKRLVLIASFVIYCFTNTVFGQDIPQNQVPSVTVNSFQQTFPKAFDVEWKLDGENYKVEFEVGLYGTDHEVWYDKAGKLVRHEEDISKDDLPQKISNKISTDFVGYSVDDVEKITEGDKTIYKLELKSLTEEWKVAFDSEGNILSKVAD